MNLIKNPALYLCILAVLSAALFLLIWDGDILLNCPSAEKYPIRGADVSAWQGDIDWQEFSREDIDFLYIKATEGSGHIDSCFERNLEGALSQNIAVGAYHFFSYDSSGAAQAEHFISVVPKREGMLTPVIDVEFYGNYESSPPEKTNVTRELTTMIKRLTEYYSTPPIIYATMRSYSLYIADEYPQCGIWIREVAPCTEPVLPDGRQWLIWQYTNRYKPRGLSGGVRYMDMNVFSGTEQDFSNILQ